MPRDYKGLANTKSKQKERNSPGWVWFVSGVLVGLFSAGLVWLKFTSPVAQTGTQPAADDPAHSASRGAAAEKRGNPPPPRFDFYTLLPEMEVVIPEEELKGPASSRPAANAPSPQPSKTVEQDPEAYLLQMGSFRNHADADRMKARLALLDIPADIQKVTINNKDTFHRVRSGPYKNRGRVSELRTRLRQNSIKSMVIRLKK